MNNSDLSWKVHITTLPDIKNTKKNNLVDNVNKHQHRQIKLEAQPTEPVSLT